MVFKTPKPTRFSYILQACLLFSAFCPSEGILRMRWDNVADPTREAILNSGAFNKSYTKINVNILQEARLPGNPGNVLYTCEIRDHGGKVEELIYAALTEVMTSGPPGPNVPQVLKIHFNSIGNGLTNISSTHADKQIALKHAAELYQRSHCAFQTRYVPVESTEEHDQYRKVTGTLSTFSLPDTVAADVKNSLKIHRYWIRVKDKQMVVIYSNSDRSCGAYAVIVTNVAGGTPDVIYFKVVGSLVSTYKAASERLNSELAFLPGWNTNKVEIEKQSSDLENKLRDVPWLSNKINITLHALDEPKGLLQGSIFLVSGSYQKNTLFAIWKHEPHENMQLMHASFAGKLEETLYSYQSFSKIHSIIGIPTYKNGVGYCYKGNSFLNAQNSQVVRAAIKLRKDIPSECSVTEYGLLPNLPGNSYDSILNFCVNLSCPNFEHLVLIKFIMDNNTKEKVALVVAEDSKYIDRSTPNYEETVKAAVTKLTAPRYIISNEWHNGMPNKFGMSTITSSVFMHSTIVKPVVKHYSGNGTKLLLIIMDASVGTITENSRVCFIALNNFTGTSYNVTFVGDLISEVEEADGIIKAKLQAEHYERTAVLAFQPNWVDHRANNADAPDGQVLLLYVWKINKEDEYSPEIKIFGAKAGNGYSKFCYQPVFWSMHTKALVSGRQGMFTPSIQDVLKELDSEFYNPLLFAETFTQPGVNDIRLPPHKIKGKIAEVASKFKNEWDVAFEKLIFPLRVPTLGLLVLKQKPLSPTPIINSKITAKSKAPKAMPVAPGVPCTILVPIKIVNGKYSRTGEVIEIKARDYENEASKILSDPFPLTASAWGKCNSEFPPEVAELIFDCASWKTHFKDIILVSERVYDLSAPVQTVFMSCCIKGDSNKFLVICTRIANAKIINVLYVGGFGNEDYVNTACRDFISSKLGFAVTEMQRGVATLNDSDQDVIQFREKLHHFLALREGKTDNEALNFGSGKYGALTLGQVSKQITGNSMDIYCLFGWRNEHTYTSIVVWTKKNVYKDVEFVSLEFGKDSTTHRHALSVFAALQHENHYNQIRKPDTFDDVLQTLADF